MADAIIQLPYTGTTSGDLLDATTLTVGANTVKRERMVLSNDASTAVAVVTSSGDLKIALSSGVVTLSSNHTVNISSGIITLSSNPTVTIGASLVNLGVAPVDAITAVFQPITSSAGGLVNVSSGIITLTSGVILTSATLVGIIGTSGGQAVVTTSGGVQVHLTNASASGGSTAVSIEGAAGILAPVTSSYGVQISSRTTGRTFAVLRSTSGAPVTQVLSTLPLWMYSLTVLSTVAGTAGNAIALHSVGASALSSMTGLIQLTNIAAVGPQFQYIFPNGVNFPAGLQLTVSLAFGTTGSNTASATMIYNVEYEV